MYCVIYNCIFYPYAYFILHGYSATLAAKLIIKLEILTSAGQWRHAVLGALGQIWFEALPSLSSLHPFSSFQYLREAKIFRCFLKDPRLPYTNFAVFNSGDKFLARYGRPSWLLVSFWSHVEYCSYMPTKI